MVSPKYLLSVFYLFIQASHGEIVMTQSQDYISVSPGETVTISCTSSEDIGNALDWFQQKSGQRIKLLIYGATNRYTGVPDRITGSGSGSSYKLTIREVTEDDAANYHCIQRKKFPLTQCYRVIQKPSSVLRN
ncbi:hypothetical protein GDO81_028588 [Engystomops pustulosus]|uniref:Ig-like domain-containing protein n=1 Tax=Engystomops pustulosus TaxID=76066 RepID=A0AAV6YN48_ENGPU|nr:hypothetical protein GDO81_028588 [Engystomops pustulosus]